MQCPNDGYEMARHYSMTHVCPKCLHSVSEAVAGPSPDYILLLLENQRAMMIDARMRYGPGDSMYEQWTAQLDATDAAIKELKGEHSDEG